MLGFTLPPRLQPFSERSQSTVLGFTSLRSVKVYLPACHLDCHQRIVFNVGLDILMSLLIISSFGRVGIFDVEVEAVNVTYGYASFEVCVGASGVDSDRRISGGSVCRSSWRLIPSTWRVQNSWGGFGLTPTAPLLRFYRVSRLAGQWWDFDSGGHGSKFRFSLGGFVRAE
ncbi:hypothetical protein P691DRAFT_151209 [Macrolepiota fuliginosa MF-IS2]|uniref:Uncharacterized protein n=1 Tax=Macrolepiota fuliginosa MF-IS2 TaxID=1400762 RepID=A0A9P5X966_9AGAR|nr:hypothetical protein P691DRAFT_151209 [Macrolepiota fuliginosa MF-IS2]